MLYRVGPNALLYPTTVWLAFLIFLFATESIVMIALPLIWPNELSPLVAAMIDALTITTVAAPLIWWTLVRPLREVIRLRTQLLGDLFTAIEAERRQTAHELHDGIGQELSLLISGLRSAHLELANPEQSSRCLELQTLAQSALAEVKRIALGLRPAILDDLGLIAALERVVRDFREHSGVALTLKATGLEGVALSDSATTALFRIFQEALANIVRHSGASNATIELNREGDVVNLRMSDDGRGFDPKNAFARTSDGSHLGLIGMRERVALLGGRFSLEASPGKGCRIWVAVPIQGKVHV